MALPSKWSNPLKPARLRPAAQELGGRTLLRPGYEGYAGTLTGHQIIDVECFVLNKPLYSSQMHDTLETNGTLLMNPITTPAPRTVTVCAIMKDEGPYILEWVAFQKIIGVNEIIIFDNETRDGSETVLRSLARAGEIICVPWPDRPGASPQTTAYKEAMTRVRTEWVCFIDTDEFINLHKHDSIQDFLDSFPADVSAIAFNWRVFGSSGLETAKQGLVIERFLQAAEVGFHTNCHVKTIARFVDMEEMAIHRCFLKRGKYVNPSGESIEIIKMGYSPRPDFTVAQLNHYVVKSKEEYILKKNRGNVNRAPDSAEKYKKINEEFFIYHDRNEVVDDTILRFRAKVADEIGRLEKIVALAGTL
jgi:hypothetical protein